MDNQYNQPGGGYPPQYPAGQQNPGYGAPADPYAATPQQGYGVPADPYATTPQQGYGVPADPYAAMPQQGYGAPADPYATMPQQGYRNAAESFGTTAQYTDMNTGYGAQQPYADPGMSQAPYADPGAYQQPYAEDGYQHLFSQAAPEQPPMGFPPQQRKPMKRRMTASDIALIVVALVAVVGFAVWYLYSTYAPEAARYGVIASGSLSANHAGDCLIVRNESPYDAEGVTSIAYDAKEGSKVYRNTPVCRVYSTGYSASAINLLQQYRAEIRDYQKKLIDSNTIYDGKLTRLDTELMSLVTQVRELVSGGQGSLANLEAQLTQKVSERQQHLEQKYASDQRFSRMQDDQRSQTQRIDSWTKLYTATGEALVSFYSDGYEYTLNANTYTSFEPSEVRAMINGKKPEQTTLQKSKTTIYRMVRDNEWYILFLSDNTSWNPVNGETYELSLERFENTTVTAQVVSFTRSGGELLVRLKVQGPVEPVMYMRTCEAVLGESMSTLMVNERAIYEQDGMKGVVVVEGSTESFIPVNVIHYKDGYAYFQAIQQGLLFEEMTVRLF
ncbi:MAG: hypothetical protein E7327_02925 [Clostridiales bacterium]|nr:hypothetical protein [Clostridiales bacterium]